jgi:two-component system NarL family sensor kinase
MEHSTFEEEALLRQERLAALAPVPSTVELNASGIILRASKAAAALLGYGSQDLAGRTLEEFAPEDWRATTQVALRRLQQHAGGSFALMMVGRGGRPTLIEMAPQSLPQEPESSGEPTVTVSWTARRHSRQMTTSGSSDASEIQRLADGVLRRYEVTRASVSTDLSDEIASVMTMVRYVIEDAGLRLARGSVQETAEALTRAGEQLRAATARVQTLSSELRPRVLDDLGLVPALAWFVRRFCDSHVDIAVSQTISAAQGAIPPTLHLTIFRVVQAAFDNVACHAKASEVRLMLAIIDGELRLAIEDNGIGFDVERWQNGSLVPHGCGLLMIRRWIEATGGYCTFEATLRRGSCIRALWRLPAVDVDPSAFEGA